MEATRLADSRAPRHGKPRPYRAIQFSYRPRSALLFPTRILLMCVRRSLRQPFALLLSLIVVILSPLHAEEVRRPTKIEESEARLKRDVTFLASDECEGRGPTTAGLKIAGDYIADEFKKA